MDFKQGLSYRHHNYKNLDRDGMPRYDWESNGVLIKVLPKILFRANPTLVAFLQLIDMEIISLLKAIRRIENWKNIFYD